MAGRVTPTFLNHPRGWGERGMEFLFGKGKLVRFSLRSLLIGLLACAAACGAAYGSFGSDLFVFSFVLFLGLGTITIFVLATILIQRNSPPLWRGSLLLILSMVLLGFLMGWGLGLLDFSIGDASPRAQYVRTKGALEQYMLAHGAYPGSLEALAPGYLRSDEVRTMDRRIRYVAPKLPGGQAELYLEQVGSFAWRYSDDGLPLPPKVASGQVPNTASPGGSVNAARKSYGAGNESP